MSEYKPQGKPPLQLLDPHFLAQISYAMQEGEQKHGEHIYYDAEVAGSPVFVTEAVGAALRHCFAVLEGEDIDEESGLYHTAKAAAALQVVHYLISRDGYEGADDRNYDEAGNSMGRRTHFPDEDL